MEELDDVVGLPVVMRNKTISSGLHYSMYVCGTEVSVPKVIKLIINSGNLPTTCMHNFGVQNGPLSNVLSFHAVYSLYSCRNEIFSNIFHLLMHNILILHLKAHS